MAKTSLSGPENLHTLVSILRCILCFQRLTFFRTYCDSFRVLKQSSVCVCVCACVRAGVCAFVRVCV